MKESNLIETDDVNEVAERNGIPYSIQVSPELSEVLKPNEFISGLGIHYLERIGSIMRILKGNLIPKDKGGREAMPHEAVLIPFSLATGPFIREELITIKAELTDDDGEAGILLTAILEEE